jgi:hypothetical protein
LDHELFIETNDGHVHQIATQKGKKRTYLQKDNLQGQLQQKLETGPNPLESDLGFSSQATRQKKIKY